MGLLRYKRTPLALAAVITAASLVYLFLATGAPGTHLFQRNGQSAVGESRETITSAAAAEAALRSGERAECAACGVVEGIRPVEIRASTPQADSAASSPGDALLVPRTVYRVTVRMDDGSYRTISQPARPTVMPGDRVRVADGTVSPM